MSKNRGRQNERQQADIQSIIDQIEREPLKPQLKTDVSHLKSQYPGKVFRWFNDTPGRIAEMQRQNWEVVEGSSEAGTFLGSQANNRQNAKNPSAGSKNDVSYMSIVVGANSATGTAEHAVLMMIDERIFNALENRKMQRIDQIDEAMKMGKKASTRNGIDFEDDSTYAPNLPNGQRGMSETIQEEL